MVQRWPRFALFILLAATAALGAQPATGTLEGVVVTDETPGVPVARAIVRLAGDRLAHDRGTITDGEGRFSFADLPPGQYTLAASKTAYVAMAFGAKRPSRPGTAITLAAGQRASVAIQVIRGAVIAGTIRDHAGDRAVDVAVNVFRRDELASIASTTFLESRFQTDDRGDYRIYGLAPGDYLVVAKTMLAYNSSVDRMTSSQMDATLRQLEAARTARAASAPLVATASRVSPAPVFFPGTTVVGDAQSITVAAGEERRADFSMPLASTAAVEGVVSSATGPLPPARVALNLEGPDLPFPFSLGATAIMIRTPDANGRFKFTGVLPGRYLVTVRSASAAAGRGDGDRGTVSFGQPAANPTDVPLLFGSTEVAVNGLDLSGVNLVLQPGMTVGGRVMFDAVSGPPPADLSAIRVSLVSPDTNGSPVTINGVTVTPFAVPPAAVRADGSFEITGVMPGRYRLTATSPGSSWWLRSAVVGNRDGADVPIQMMQSQNVTGAVVTFTDRPSGLGGRLQTTAGVPATDFFVIVFPVDRTLWIPKSRRIRSTRPATDGTFVVKNLPAGEYFIAALTDMIPSDVDSAVFLNEVVPASVRATLGEGEARTQDLQIR